LAGRSRLLSRVAVKNYAALAPLVALAVVVPAALVDCTVTPNETCFSGPCVLPDAGFAFATAASSSSSSSGAGGGDAGKACMNPATGDFPCAVYDVLQRKCHVCHATDLLPTSGAPFSLLTWEDTQLPISMAVAKIRYKRMGEVILPGSLPHMPFGCPMACPPSGDLSDGEREILEDWATSCGIGVPEGTDQKCTQMCMGAPCKPQ
jgi:hypothetical protein